MILIFTFSSCWIAILWLRDRKTFVFNPTRLALHTTLLCIVGLFILVCMHRIERVLVHILAHLLLMFTCESVKLKRCVIFCLSRSTKHLVWWWRLYLNHWTVKWGLKCILSAALHGLVWVLHRALVISFVPSGTLCVEHFSNLRAAIIVLASPIERVLIYSVYSIKIN